VGDWSASRWPRRAGVLTAIAATGLLMQRAGIAGNRLSSGSAGAIVARFDLAVPLLVALVAFLTARRSLASPLSDSGGLARLPAVYIAWALTMLFAKAALHVQATGGQFVSTLVIFRVVGTPLEGLAAGPLMLVVASTVVLMPVFVGLARRPALVARPWVVPVGLAVVALVYRILCTSTGHTALFGPLSWLPNYLDLIGAGLALAVIDDRLTDVRIRRQVRVAGVATAIISFVSAAFAFGLPRSPLLNSSADIHLFALVALIFSAAVLCAVCLFPPAFTRRKMPRTAGAFAIAAPGVLLVGGAAFTLVAHQYHERVIEFDGGVFLQGNIVAPFVWSLLISCAFGVIVVAVVGGVGLLRDRQWRAIVRSRLALPTVVATGFFVRVITLLTVAPERTDGGRPSTEVTTRRSAAHRRCR